MVRHHRRSPGDRANLDRRVGVSADECPVCHRPVVVRDGVVAAHPRTTRPDRGWEADPCPGSGQPGKP